MSIPDTLIIPYFELLTDTDLKEIKEMEKAMKGSENPRDFKMRLGREIVSLYHGKAAARKAGEEFEKVFQKKEAPSEVPEKKVSKSKMNLAELIHEVGLATSKSEARRLITQGGVKVSERKMNDPNEEIELGKEPILLQVGKRKFLRVGKS